MPESINWQGIQANSVSLGIRGAARAASSHLSADEQETFVQRVLKRARREKWEEQRIAAQSLAPKQQGPVRTLSANVRNPADSIAITLLERKQMSRLHQSKYLVRATEKLSEVPDEQLLEHSVVAVNLATAHAKQYPEESISASLTLNLYGIVNPMAGNGHEPIDV